MCEAHIQDAPDDIPQSESDVVTPEEEKSKQKNTNRKLTASSGEKTGRESKNLSLKVRAVGVGREKQARKPMPEANSQEAERKLGVEVRI